jgi:hypothetical protein
MKMALTYTEEKSYTKTERVEKTLTVPSSWGMYTSQGNRRIKAKADSLVKKLEKAESYSDKIKAFEQYFKSYRKVCFSRSKGIEEAGDTDVREHVWSFAVRAGKAVDIGYNTLDELWEQYY